MNPAGDYSIGSQKWPGLSKLIEEMGEVQQLLGKLIATNGEPAHWDGSNLIVRLQEELADLAAAMIFFLSRNKLDTPLYSARVLKKVEQFKQWHTAQKSPAKEATT